MLVIIAGALAVPWQRMEQLSGQPSVKAARFAADLAFRNLHARAAAGLPTTYPATGPATQQFRQVGLTDQTYIPPRIYALPGPSADISEDAIAQQALRIFRQQPEETEFGRVITLPDKSRIYRYAAAIRAEVSCIQCHADYRRFGRLPGAAPATASATRPLTDDAPGPVVGVVRIDTPYQTDEDQLLLNRIVIVVAGMLGGTLAIVVFYLITSRLILQPVRVLKSTAEKVASGDLNIRSAISTGDEFQHLSETFNHMLATLKASQDQLESSNRSLDTRVGELAQSNVDLYEANRIKSEFLTNVTHELRTPLNAIIGFAELMAGAVKDPKQQRYVENIRVSAKQLLDLINDLLDLAKIEAGKLVLREEKVNVADVCEAMANFMKPLAIKKEIAIELSVSPDMPLITTDPGRFQQILYNFLSNAIKFTPQEGRITIAARNESADIASTSAIRVSITDTGPGISPEDQQVIFEKFRQIDGSVTRQHPGTGLGLTISRELANMLGGRIELQSTLGKGSTFSLILPVTSPHRTIHVDTMLENI